MHVSSRMEQGGTEFLWLLRMSGDLKFENRPAGCGGAVGRLRQEDGQTEASLRPCQRKRQRGRQRHNFKNVFTCFPFNLSNRTLPLGTQTEELKLLFPSVLDMTRQLSLALHILWAPGSALKCTWSPGQLSYDWRPSRGT